MRATHALAADWLPLTGSEKQVTQATDIRCLALAHIMDVAPDTSLSLARAHPNLHWWIEHRDTVDQIACDWPTV